MDLRRARIGDWLMGGFGVVVIVALFLGWYCAPPPGVEGAGECGSGAAVSAWEAFAVVDVVLLVAALIAVVALVMTLVHDTPAVPLALTAIGTLVAIVAAVLAVVRLAAAPDLPGAGEGVAPVRLAGAWLGAGATLALALAMLASIRDERTPARSRRAAEAEAAMRTLSVGGADDGRDKSSGAARPEGAS
jgi:hypothetical protein